VKSLSDLKCDLNCERCARIIEAVNRVYIAITGIPFTDMHCPLELLDQARKAKSVEEADRLETKILLKNIRNIY
jgi:hypothetical protein